MSKNNTPIVTPTVTIDELAIMIKIGFDEVHSDIAAMDAKFESKFDLVNKEISSIKSDIVCIRGEIYEIRQDIAGIHGEIAEIKQDVAGIHVEIAGMKQDIAGIHRDMATKDDVEELKSHFLATDKTVYKDHAPRI